MTVKPAGAYRSLLRAIRDTIDAPYAGYYRQSVRRQFEIRASSTDAEHNKQLLQLAEQYSQHLKGTQHHAEMLRRYNITVSRDGSQKANVESIAHKVGLRVPEELPAGNAGT